MKSPENQGAALDLMRHGLLSSDSEFVESLALVSSVVGFNMGEMYRLHSPAVFQYNLMLVRKVTQAIYPFINLFIEIEDYKECLDLTRTIARDTLDNRDFQFLPTRDQVVDIENVAMNLPKMRELWKLREETLVKLKAMEKYKANFDVDPHGL